MTRPLAIRIASLLAGLSLVSFPTPSFAQVSGTWSAVSDGGVHPSPRRNYASMYDAANQRYIVFAGEWGNLYGGYQLFNEVWALTLGPTPTWSPLATQGSPPGERHSPQFGFDAARNRLLVFGGYGKHYPGSTNYEYLSDVWQLSLDGTPTWTELFPTGTPPPGRLAGAAVYDDFRQRFVGFGGTVGLPVDTWELDLSGEPAWNPVTTSSTAPPGMYGMASVFDARRDRMIIFGGSTSDNYFGVHNDTWVLNLRGGTPTWHKLNPAGTLPAARRTMTSIYDPIRDRMIVYGGWDSGGEANSHFLGDTWELSLENNPTWTQLAPAGSLPTGRDATAAIYDPVNDQLAVYGGWTGTDMLADSWLLHWGATGVAAAMATSSSASPTNAHVEWDITDNTSPYAAVYRREGTGPWTSLSIAQADVSGHLAFDDAAVTPGAQYGYMVVVPSEKGSQFGGQANVTVPTVTGVGDRGSCLALERVQPNPVRAQFAVSFTLTDDSRASLELYDVNGRRVLERAVGLGAGRHTVSLGAARDFGAGMYFLRLTSRGQTLNQRVVIGH
ncbi:MAG TPA: kelch repeat-containing protein [Methylomirabilota bacterium]|nr:kelch repeat-containing protein [Methylomirabilota bacterium]